MDFLLSFNDKMEKYVKINTEYRDICLHILKQKNCEVAYA